MLCHTGRSVGGSGPERQRRNVIAHATNLVEHPELVADRLARYANLVGRENVIAGTDCGLGGRLHPEIVWAKFQAMAGGARLASEQLWRR